MCLFNSRSIVNKLSNLQSFVYSSNYTIYCITETWLSESVSDFEILPGNFSIFRKDRGSRGGGVLIAVDASVPCSVVSSPSNDTVWRDGLWLKLWDMGSKGRI